MEYSLLKFFHILGAVLIGSGLIGVWMADLRSRQLYELKPFSEAVRNIAVFYDGFVVPGALLLLISGTWMIVKFYGGWNFVQVPWLAGMVGLFAFEFIEGNKITRLYFMRLRPSDVRRASHSPATPSRVRHSPARSMTNSATFSRPNHRNASEVTLAPCPARMIVFKR
jgi:Predicted integral membrane protein (DUF2269)